MRGWSWKSGSMKREGKRVSNLDLYNKVRAVPAEAQKAIGGGRLKGKTDINPMWRIKALTENFGVCGIGWKYNITKQWLETGSNGEISAFVNIDLFIKVDGAWSDAIPGTGGSAFVAKESGGLYTSDECYKMALTDAISVSCKALGFGADVYWNADKTKYSQPSQPKQEPKKETPPPPSWGGPQGASQAPPSGGKKTITEAQQKRLFAICTNHGVPNAEVKEKIAAFGFASSKDLDKTTYDLVCEWAENYDNPDNFTMPEGE